MKSPPPISTRLERVQAPIIPMVADLIANNPGTISLGQGVVNYPPPAGVYTAVQAIERNPELNKYQHVQGTRELKCAIARKLESDNGVALHARDLVVTAGSNMGFVNAVLAIADPGDEIVLLSPYFFNHEMAIGMLGCRAVTVDTDENYQPVIADIERVLGERTRAVVTVSPNNPTGAVYDADTLAGINRLCADKGIYHISDEAYEYFVYAGARHFSPCGFDTSESHTIGLYSLSKAYGFASWRIGYMVIPEHLSDPIRKIQDTNLICPPMISQCAALEALRAGQAFCRAHINRLGEVRGQVLEALRGLGELVYIPPSNGAFYCLIRVNLALGSMQLVKRLIEEFGVAVIPGSTFGVPDEQCTIRIAYGALAADTVNEGIGRLVDGVRQIARSHPQGAS